MALMNLCLGQELIPVSPHAHCCAQTDDANRMLNASTGHQCHCALGSADGKGGVGHLKKQKQ